MMRSFSKGVIQISDVERAMFAVFPRADGGVWLSASEGENLYQLRDGRVQRASWDWNVHGIKAIGATLTPYGGAGYSCDKGEQVREAVNNWIRTSGTFDGVVDFDQITRDAQNLNNFNALYDSGDHLHPSDAGYKAMGDGIDLKLFK